MLTRTADSLFWMTRYLERTDCILRTIRSHYMSSLDKNEESDFSWRPVLKTFTKLEKQQISEIEYRPTEVLKYLISDKTNEDSILNNITRSRENARSAQEHITLEVWQCLNSFYLEVKGWEVTDTDASEVLAGLGLFTKNTLPYYGIAEVTMPRNEGWTFMNLGKFLERAIQTADFLDIKFYDLDYDMQQAFNPIEWRHVLQSVSGFEFYLKAYQTGVQAENIVDMLVLNQAFPRSIYYSVSHLQKMLERVRNTSEVEAYNTIAYQLGKIASKLQYATVADISKIGLKEYLKEIKEELSTVGNYINTIYFHYA